LNQNEDDFKPVLAHSDLAIRMAAVSEQIEDLNGELTKAGESFSVQLMKTIRKQTEQIQELKMQQEKEMNRLKAEISELKAYQLQIEKDYRQSQLKHHSPSKNSSKQKQRLESISVQRKLNSQNNYGYLLKTIECHSGYCISCLVVMEDGRLVSGSYDDTIIIWNSVNTDQLFNRTLRGHTGAVYCLVGLNENRLASGSNDTTIIIWDVNTGYALNKLIGHMNRVSCLAKLNDDQLASGSRDNTIKIWNLNSGQEIRTLMGHAQDVRCMLALPDYRLATGSHDDTIRIWNIHTGECILELEGHNGYVLSLILFRDEFTLASSSADATIRIWDLLTGRLLKLLREHDGPITSLALLNDGRMISGSEDRSVIIWK